MDALARHTSSHVLPHGPQKEIISNPTWYHAGRPLSLRFYPLPSSSNCSGFKCWPQESPVSYPDLIQMRFGTSELLILGWDFGAHLLCSHQSPALAQWLWASSTGVRPWQTGRQEEGEVRHLFPLFSRCRTNRLAVSMLLGPKWQHLTCWRPLAHSPLQVCLLFDPPLFS